MERWIVTISFAYSKIPFQNLLSKKALILKILNMIPIKFSIFLFSENYSEGHRLIMDNDSKHKSKLTNAFFKSTGINHWLTPPQSPVCYFK